MKRYLSLLLCLCLTFTLFSCRNSAQSFEKLLNEAGTVTEGESEGAIAIHLDAEALYEGVSKIGYMETNGSLDGFTVDEEEKQEALDGFAMIPENISLKFNGVVDEEMSTKGTMSLEFGEITPAFEFVMDMKSGMYLNVEDVAEIVYDVLALAGEMPLDNIDKETFVGAFSDYDYLKMGFDTEELEDTLALLNELDYSKLYKISEIAGAFIDKYLENNITATADGCEIRFTLATLKEDILKICEKIDANPGAFFDYIAKIVAAYKETGIFEVMAEEDMSISDAIDMIDEFLGYREEFVENWNEADYNAAIEEIFAEYETSEAYKLLGNSELVMYLGKKGNDFVENLEINVYIDSEKPCLSMTVETATRKADIPLISESFTSEAPLDYENLETVLQEKLMGIIMASMPTDTVA